MTLAVDIGNTRVRLGLVGRDGVGALARVPTASPTLAQDFRGVVQRLAPMGEQTTVAVASVVPAATEALLGPLQIEGRVVTEVTPEAAGLRIGYSDPAQMGADRLANAIGAIRRYGAPAIVVDVGTALTLEVVDADGTLWGGPVFPGPALARKALGAHAARLRGQTGSRKGGSVLGDSTEACLAAGIDQGYPALVEGLVERARGELGVEAPAVLTGGGAPVVGDSCRGITAWDPLLTLRGVAACAERTLP